MASNETQLGWFMSRLERHPLLIGTAIVFAFACLVGLVAPRRQPTAPDRTAPAGQPVNRGHATSILSRI